MNEITRSSSNPYRQVNTSYESSASERKSKNNAAAAAPAGTDPALDDAVTYTPSGHYKASKPNSTNAVKTRSDSDKEIARKAIASLENKTEKFKELISKLLHTQASRNVDKNTFPGAVGATQSGSSQTALYEIDQLNIGINTMEETSGIGEDDYWGVEATANRIVDFAVSLSGGNPETMAMLKDVVHDAFGDCEKVFGGKLPDISYQTLDRIDELFDTYKQPDETAPAE